MIADTIPDTRQPSKGMTALEAAARLGVHERTIRRAIGRGELAAIKQGRAYRISEAALARYSRRRRGEAGTCVTRPPLPRSLPTPLTPLIGREQEIATVCALLRGGRNGEAAARLLTLTGPGGIGKTRLALRAADELRGDFADGAVFVDLSQVMAPELVIATVARALNAYERCGTLLDGLKAALAPSHLLLVLDNFEHLLPAAPMVADLLAACPRLAVLVASRCVLRITGEQTFPVPPLGLPERGDLSSPEQIGATEAVRLFVARARLAVPAFALTGADARTVADICRRIDGLPLAIELAAAHVRHLTLPTLLKRIDEPVTGPALQMLDGGGCDQPPRLRGLREAITWSYELLTPEQRRHFRCLAVFAGTFSLEAAEALCGNAADRPETSGSVFASLRALVEHSLVRLAGEPAGQSGQAAESRFAMLKTIREFALEQLAAAGATVQTRQHHAEWCLALAEQEARRFYTAEDHLAVARIEAEFGNVRAALLWALEQCQAELALRLAGVLARVWYVHGRCLPMRTWLEHALALDPAKKAPPLVRAQVLGWLGVLALHQGDHLPARAWLEEALALYRDFGDESAIGRILLWLAVAAECMGEHDRAAAWYQAALARFRALGESVRVAVVLANRGDVAGVSSAVTAARLIEATEALCEEIETERASATVRFSRVPDPYPIVRPTTARPASHPLTPREIEILRMLAEGLSNKEIAATLQLARRTVGNHVSAILAKLDLDSRTAAAAYAIRRGLV